ncbi:hypothetical protein QAD02_019345 [Eretmocerus hayati]|uniref:Uncharacterized protein n=1 Tax=Eretmocerus hayati TaxID=131215 RepID=A0ACC2PKH8_9HYME|nr:hypothetical protein QAD02_019345 [Eretmocerus hayati]
MATMVEYTKMRASDENHKDLLWALGLNRFTLRIMGLWPDGNDTKESIGNSIRVPIMIMFMLFALFLPQMYALVLVINDLPLVLDNLMTSISSFTSSFKLFFLWHNKKVLRPVVESAIKDWMSPKNNWKRETMINQAKLARFFTIGGYGVIVGCLVSFSAAPLIGIDIRMISNITDYGDRYLMVQSYFPYDYSKSPAFELTYASQVIGGICVALCVSSPDNYFGALVLHAAAQFEILAYDIEHFLCKSEDSADNEEEFRKELGCLVDRHVHLTRMMSAVEKSFNLVIAAQLFCMSAMICCLGFQILNMFSNSGNKSSLLQIMTLIATLIMLMIHTLLDCFASETVMTSRSRIFYSVYNIGWYRRPKKIIRDLIPMMVISAKPPPLTAGKIYYLSLATYAYVSMNEIWQDSFDLAVTISSTTHHTQPTNFYLKQGLGPK